MINLKRTLDEIKEDEEIEENPYPWGTRIDLEDEQLAALNLSVSIGDKVSIRAKAEVVNQNQNEDKDHEHTSMTFQITDIEITEAGPSASEVLYSEV